MTTIAPLLLKSTFTLLACSLLFATTPLLAGGDPWLEQAKLIASDGADDSEFGISVALAGDTAVVGARNANVDGNSGQGAAYVFAIDGESWNEQAKLVSADGAAGERFGFSAALMGDTALVGAPFADSGQGAAYVFVYDGENWNEQAKLIASDGALDDEFGFSVALFGDTALVGAARAKVGGFDNGAAYVFTRDGAGVWSQVDKLVPDDWPFGSCTSAFCPQFGHSIAVWENTALVGAYREEVNGLSRAGAAYVFVLDGGDWSQQARLTRPAPAANEVFGTSVALRGDTALVGAPVVEVNGQTQQGVTHIFNRDGGIWAEEQELTALDGEPGYRFGTSVALLDNTALVGAPTTNLSGPGAAYRYSRDAGIWSEEQQLAASDGDVFWFGHSVALSGSRALAGAPYANSFQGAAYVFAGSEAGGPDLIFEPAGLDFGTLEVGTTSAPQPATLSNIGVDDATGLTFNTPGNGFDVDTSACGDSLTAGGDCEVSITFTPAAAGPAGAILTADSDQSASADLVLTGEGDDATGLAQLSFTPAGRDFGDVEVGTASAPQTATLSNTGDSDATGLTFNTPGGGFDVDSSGCGAILTAGGDCEVSVTFTPAATGPANDTLTVEGDDEVSASLSLTGNGTKGNPAPGILSVEPAELDFGTLEVGSDEVLNIIVSNAAEAGADALTLAALDLDGGGAGAGDPETIRVSLKPDGNQFGYDVFNLVMSADGRYVAFEGTVPINFRVIYRRDLLNGITEEVSVDADGNRVNIHGWDLAISADGRYVAYVHPYGSNPPIQDGPPGIYIRDMDTGVTQLVDLPTTDGELPDRLWPHRPAISADARIVAFAHTATNLLPGACSESIGDPNCDDMYVYDRDAETLERLSTAFDGTASDGGNHLPVITPDGRFIAWRAEASNLVPDDTNGEVDVFVHDRDTGVTERVSVAADGSEGNDGSGKIWWPAITPDGRYVSFGSQASNLVPDDTNGQRDVFVRDRIAHTTVRVSVASDGSQTKGGPSAEPSAISADGRFVTFRSEAWNLVPDDLNGVGDHFVHDRLTGVTERISVRTDGSEDFNHSMNSRLAISADGRFAAFPTNKILVPGDTNGKVDIYVRDRGGPPLGSAFAITGGDCAVDTVLEAGESCMVEITFSPPGPGDFEGTLNVETDDEQSASVLLQGTGAVGPVLAFNPSVLDFGDVEVGTTSAPENATLTNAGVIDATGLAFTQPTSGFDADTSDCGNTLPAGESCQVVITFTPPATGLSFASMDAQSDEGATARLNLAGNGTQQPPMPDQIFHSRFETGGAQ